MRNLSLEAYDKLTAKLDRLHASLFVLTECVEYGEVGAINNAIMADAMRAVLDHIEEAKALLKGVHNV